MEGSAIGKDSKVKAGHDYDALYNLLFIENVRTGYWYEWNRLSLT